MKRTIFLLAIIGVLIGVGYMAYASLTEEGISSASANAAPSASSAAPLIP